MPRQTAQVDLRQRRHRLDLAPHLSPVHSPHRSGNPARAVSRPFGGRERSPGRPDRHDVRSGRHRDAAYLSGKRQPIAVTAPSAGRRRSQRCPPRPRRACPSCKPTAWTALFFPKGTPKAIVERVNAAVDKAMRDRDHRQAAGGSGRRSTGSAGPAHAAGISEALVRSEIDKWVPLIQAAGRRTPIR